MYEPASRSGFGNTQSNALEQSLLATRLLGPAERTSSRFGDVGQAILPGHQELFAEGGPALALQQQFHKLRPEFIAIHEVGSSWSRKLLVGIANATGRSLQQLEIRREGSGVTLATVDYVECPSTDGGLLRIYSTDVTPGSSQLAASADPACQQIALVLLAYARLGVMMVGNIPVSTMRTVFTPLHDAMHQGPWPNRNLLLLPLTSAGALASIGGDLFEDTGVTVRTTPQVTRSADAWSFISGTWNRLREELRNRNGGFAGQSVILPALPGARTADSASKSATVSSVPDVGGSANAAAAAPAPALAAVPATSEPDLLTALAAGPVIEMMPSVDDPTALGRFVERISDLPGLTACGVFAKPTGLEVGDVVWPDLPFFARSSPEPSSRITARSLTEQGRSWLRALRAGTEALGLGSDAPQAAFTMEHCHLLLRAVPRRPDLMLIAIFDRTDKPMLHEFQLRRIEAEFEAPAA